jgi:hypothetical protein
LQSKRLLDNDAEGPGGIEEKTARQVKELRSSPILNSGRVKVVKVVDGTSQIMLLGDPKKHLIRMLEVGRS